VLRALIAKEHPTEWARYLEDGTYPTLEELLEPEDDADSPRGDALEAGIDDEYGPRDDPWADDP